MASGCGSSRISLMVLSQSFSSFSSSVYSPSFPSLYFQWAANLGILDQLFDGQYIAKDEYLYCLQEFQKHNGGEVRLPRAELKKRLDRLSDS